MKLHCAEGDVRGEIAECLDAIPDESKTAANDGERQKRECAGMRDLEMMRRRQPRRDGWYIDLDRMQKRGEVWQDRERDRHDHERHHDQPAPKQIAPPGVDMELMIAEPGVVEFVALERDVHPRQGQAQRDDGQYAVTEIKPEIIPS